MTAVGQFIRVANFVLRLLQLCASVIILGIFSYFLAVIADHNLGIEKWVKAVTGIAGGATFYTLLGSAFTLAVGGVPFLSGLAMFLDFCFAASFIAIAVMSRHGTSSCDGEVETPLGSGDANDPGTGFGGGGFGTGDDKNLTYLPNLKSACKLQKAVLAISIIGIFLFLISIPAQRSYTKHRNEVKHFGSKANKGYDEPSGIRRFWPFSRRPRPGPRTTQIDYDANRSSFGTIPLEDRQPQDKPPRYTNLFGLWKTGDNARTKEPQATARPKDNSGATYAHNNSDLEFGAENFRPWPRPGYGQSGIDTGDIGGYAHGYGNSPYGPSPYTPPGKL